MITVVYIWGCMLGSDLNWWPLNQTLSVQWDTTGQTHWNHTAWCYPPVVSQWQSSVNLHNWNTLDHHWKTTWRPLEAHWNTLATNKSFSSCIAVYTGVYVPGTLDCHWVVTELPLAQGIGPAYHLEIWKVWLVPTDWLITMWTRCDPLCLTDTDNLINTVWATYTWL